MVGPLLMVAELYLPGMSWLLLHAGRLAEVVQASRLRPSEGVINLGTLLVGLKPRHRYGFVAILWVLLLS